MGMQKSHRVTVGVVGPCSAGKTTLINGLKRCGYIARHIAQEHSYVPEMWQKITSPKVLIYLDVSYEQCITRKHLNLTRQEFEEEVDRLKHARQHATLYIHTDNLTEKEVLEKVLRYLQDQKIPPNTSETPI
jgi:thymidylate kinase